MSKVLIADDHPLFRQALRMALTDAKGGEPEVLEASSVEDARSMVAQNNDLDLCLLDLKMPGMDGFAGLAEMRRLFPSLPVVVVSATEDPKVVREALGYGAMGYIPKSYGGSSIREALERVLEGEVYVPACAGEDDLPSTQDGLAERLSALTPQQLRVLKGIGEGKPNKIIAYELDIAEKTVKAHITVILRKLGVHSRTQAALMTRDSLRELE